MKIKVRVGSTDLTASVIDSETARDFVSLLPLTLTMDDLFGREKFGHLPHAPMVEPIERFRSMDRGMR